MTALLSINPLAITLIHESAGKSIKGHKEAGANSSLLWARHGLHPGQVNNLTLMDKWYRSWIH